VERDAAAEHECTQRVEVCEDDDCVREFRQRPTITAASQTLQQPTDDVSNAAAESTFL